METVDLDGLPHIPPALPAVLIGFAGIQLVFYAAAFFRAGADDGGPLLMR